MLIVDNSQLYRRVCEKYIKFHQLLARQHTPLSKSVIILTILESGVRKIKTEETKLKFYGSPAFAMLPLGVYILVGGIFSVGLHYYSMKGLIFAAVVSLLAGFFLCRNKGQYWDSIVRGLAQYGNSRLIFIFLVIGIFSKLMNKGGIGNGFIWLSLNLGISKSAFVVFSFLASAVISMGAGAPIAAMFAVLPIFYPPGILLGANPAMLAGALISGIFFGDAVSPSSQVINTTVMIQHDGQTGEPAKLLATLKQRTPYILAAGIAAMVLYAIFGGQGGAVGDISQVTALASPKGLWMLVPLAVLLFICFRTGNLFMGLSYAIVVGFAVGLVTGVITFSDIVAIDYATSGLKGIVFEGLSGMLDVAVSTILLYGLIAVAVDGGMLERFCCWILSRKVTQTRRGAEAVLTAGIFLTNVLLAGCVLPSILMFGEIADRIGQKSNIPPERRSILLMANATNCSSIIPINSAFVMGAVTIINEMVQNNSYLPTVTPFSIFCTAFYCLFLTGISIFWVVTGAGNAAEEKVREQEMAAVHHG